MKPLTDEEFEDLKNHSIYTGNWYKEHIVESHHHHYETVQSLITTVEALRDNNKQLRVCKDFKGSYGKRMLKENEKFKQENSELKQIIDHITVDNLEYKGANDELNKKVEELSLKADMREVDMFKEFLPYLSQLQEVISNLKVRLKEHEGQ